jgi:ribonuclease Z
VWISHIHADHHAGLVRIIAARKEARKALDLPPQPLVVIAPHLLRRFLTAYDRVEEMDIVFIDCAHTQGDWLQGNAPRPAIRTGLQPFSGLGIGSGIDSGERAAVLEALSRLGLTSLVSVEVIHCPQSYGVVLEAEGGEANEGLKLAYSGDTRPCSAFVEASRGATVFIHEVRSGSAFSRLSFPASARLCSNYIPFVEGTFVSRLFTSEGSHWNDVPCFNSWYRPPERSDLLVHAS